MKKILLIGDSISLDYGQYLKQFLRSDIHAYSKPGAKKAYENLDKPIGGNGGDSRKVLEYIQTLNINKALNYDYLLFNCGLHDIKHNYPSKEIQVPKQEYISNLYEIIKIVKSNSVTPIFIATTPTDETRYNSVPDFIRYNSDVIDYNASAIEIILKENMRIIDLYNFTVSLRLNGDNLFRDHTHFCKNVILLQASYIAGAINAII